MQTFTEDVRNEIIVNQYIFVRVLSKILSWFRHAGWPVLSGKPWEVRVLQPDAAYETFFLPGRVGISVAASKFVCHTHTYGLL
jgi:hypothetical protein